MKSLDKSVIPAKAGIQVGLLLDSRMRGNDGHFLVDMLDSASMDHYTANTFSAGARKLAGVIR